MVRQRNVEVGAVHQQLVHLISIIRQLHGQFGLLTVAMTGMVLPFSPVLWHVLSELKLESVSYEDFHIRCLQYPKLVLWASRLTRVPTFAQYFVHNCGLLVDVYSCVRARCTVFVLGGHFLLDEHLSPQLLFAALRSACWPSVDLPAR